MSLARIGCLAACVVIAMGDVAAQTTVRRPATLETLRQFPGFYHLQNVLVRGEFAEANGRVTLKAADETQLTALFESGATAEMGPVEVRARFVDVGRLEPDDPRVGSYAKGREAERWPNPGEELVLQITGVVAAAPFPTATVRAIALEPWKYDGQIVTVVGQFRGRNLLGDLPAAPAKGRYDFVLRSADAAIWVTGLRPRGQGFELAVDARVDTGRWVRITGTVSRERGLTMLAGTTIVQATAPSIDTAEETPTAPVPLQPLEVVFNTPTPDETDVAIDAPVRVQFSRGVDPSSLPGQIRVTYLGADASAGPQFRHSYDGATRALELRFAQPLDRLKTVRVELLGGIKAFDGGTFAPWSLTFSTGG